MWCWRWINYFNLYVYGNLNQNLPTHTERSNVANRLCSWSGCFLEWRNYKGIDQVGHRYYEDVKSNVRNAIANLSINVIAEATFSNTRVSDVTNARKLGNVSDSIKPLIAISLSKLRTRCSRITLSSDLGFKHPHNSLSGGVILDILRPNVEGLKNQIVV